MIEIINPGWPSLIVDGGRYGTAAVGVPPSSALDRYAYRALQSLIGSRTDEPALEVMGTRFALKFHHGMTFAITGARVEATLDDRPVNPWTSMKAAPGGLLRIHKVLEGLRYYIGFSGTISVERVIGSYATNLECGFGGYQGRILKAGDRIGFTEIRDALENALSEDAIPSMQPPHLLRVIAGPEASSFTDEALRRFMVPDASILYNVSTHTNRTGIRLEGEPLCFRPNADRSIISEGILPGTIQIPGDGHPIIMLYERTIGGYARIGQVAKADLDRLAHLKPGDSARFEMIDMEKATRLWEASCRNRDALSGAIREMT